jgi:hypothetical protein
MADQLLGAASVAVVVLAYVVLVEAMMAAVVLLAAFTVMQWRHLCALLAYRPPAPARELHESRGPGDDQGTRVRIGGGLRHWE